MSSPIEPAELAAELLGDDAETWDLACALPRDLLVDLGKRGLLCAEVPTRYGGLGLSSEHNGELTARVGAVCSSARSVLTSQGMAAWTIQRLGSRDQRAAYLPLLTGGGLAAVGFSETGAGSDLSALTTSFTARGDSLVVDGAKVWVTAAAYADHLVIFGRYGDGAAAAVIPASAPGVTIERVPHPLGCRAAGHANITLDAVRVPAAAVLGGGGLSLPLVVTAALSYGRMSVAWGCVGILRACLAAVTEHASVREQFGKPIGEHQLVAGHVAGLVAAEQIATRVCEHASRCWDSGSPEMVTATVLAKYVSSEQAARGAATAVQVLASAGAHDGHVVARAYRDAKLMEIIEGSSELCRLMLARSALGPGRENKP
ncbi:methoxymalonate biosynthesis protein [Nocardia tenerifensis]|uniref:Methoxymalonate biosynthesis protein n=1 Tax=Nocardia tenerifensis TaxID=228006 RepID=A0A318KGU3_9NOCA|nr:acyl-CoA dehydrogenase family protein [Nocardia tenerifensis]PXX71482.1 methoxymalonate biosynthesis protein [Nocardia tenerifensis]